MKPKIAHQKANILGCNLTLEFNFIFRTSDLVTADVEILGDIMRQALLRGQPLLQQMALGAVLGLAGGLFFASLLLVWFGAVIFYYFVLFTFGLVVIAPVGYCVKVGLSKARAGELPTLRWSTIILTAFTIIPLSLSTPLGLRILHLYAVGSYDVPVLPNSEKQKTQTSLLGGSDDGPRIVYRYHTNASPDEVTAFFGQELEQMGWKAGPEMLRKHSFKGTPNWFEKQELWGGNHLSISFLKDRSVSGTTFELTCYVVRYPPLI